MKIDNFLIDEQSSIREALAKINKNSHGIIFAKNHLEKFLELQLMGTLEEA